MNISREQALEPFHPALSTEDNLAGLKLSEDFAWHFQSYSLSKEQTCFARAIG
jgi:hypothetical protein